MRADRRWVAALAVTVLLPASSASGQTTEGPARMPVMASLLGAVDTAGTGFSFGAFADRVLAHHPVAVQAQLVADQARAELRRAWGAFDPSLSATWDRKTFNGTSYYNYLDAALKLPLPIGDVTVAFDRTLGTYVNPDRSTSGGGVLSAGLSIPLGQRLVTDERRTALQQARAARDLGEAEQVGLVNKLLFAAAKAYGGWYEAWRRRSITADGEALAAFRLDAVRRRVANGEAAPIDTVEALLEVQRRQVSRYEAEGAFYLATLDVMSFLWEEGREPRPLPVAAVPTLAGLGGGGIDSTQLASLLDRAVQRHPDLRKAEAKVRQASAERLLSAQGVLPFAALKVEGLAERQARGAGGFLDGDRLADNFKSAFEVKTPLLFLKETGKLNAATQKLDFQRIERDRLAREVEFDIRGAVFDLANLQRLLERQRSNVRQAGLLRDAEQVRFENGESTLLILNLRERLVLDEALKLAAIEAKVSAARGALALATGDRALLAAGR